MLLILVGDPQGQLMTFQVGIGSPGSLGNSPIGAAQIRRCTQMSVRSLSMGGFLAGTISFIQVMEIRFLHMVI